MLPDKLAQMLKDIQKRLSNEGKLPTVDKLRGYYTAFRERFGPDVLGSLDGEALLTTMHSHSRNSRNTLVYWLEFKNDEEFPLIFGSIAGGSALKFGIYQNVNTGAWMSRDPSNYPVEISLDKAIEIARRHRDQLIRGVSLLEKLPPNASAEDYLTLQRDMDEHAPDVSGVAWGHKYFSLLYPDKLDDYHSAHFQRFYLVKLLQPSIPDERDGRYIAAGQFVDAAQELEMPMNHLTTVLNNYTPKPYRYWKVLANYAQLPGWQNWDVMRDGNFIAIGWRELDDLSGIAHTREAREQVKMLMREKYQDSGRWGQEVFNFVTNMSDGDVVLAHDSGTNKICGIGRITGSYYFDATSSAPHRHKVEWLSTDEWQLPEVEAKGSAVRELRNYTNLVEIERRILDVPSTPPTDSKSHRLDSDRRLPVKLSGLPGRIQTILDRKGQVILYGPPGTGKTFWAENAACELASMQMFGMSFKELANEQRAQVFGRSDSYVQLCSFHPAYGYEDFLEGYRPQLLNEQMSFVRQDGIFKQICKLARKDPQCSYYLIIDEINRGDIPRIFGELLTILEKDKRGKTVLLPLSGEGFDVPRNVFIIGTMNTADRSIALLDTALRRRFGFLELLPDPTPLGSAIIEGIPLAAWLEELNKRILQYVGRDARNLQIGHAYLLENGKPVTDFAKFSRVIREDIIPLLEEYCYEDYGALKQILGATLVDEQRQVIRHDLFEPGRESDLVQALLEPTPDLTTLASVTEAESELAETVDEDELEDSEEQA